MVSVSVTYLLTAIGIFAVLGSHKSCTEYIMLGVRGSSALKFSKLWVSATIRPSNLRNGY
jgi:hypothetical protein